MCCVQNLTELEPCQLRSNFIHPCITVAPMPTVAEAYQAQTGCSPETAERFQRVGTNAFSACYKDPATGEVKEPGRKLFAKLRENKHKLGATPGDTSAEAAEASCCQRSWYEDLMQCNWSSRVLTSAGTRQLEYENRKVKAVRRGSEAKKTGKMQAKCMPFCSLDIQSRRMCI